MSLHGVKFRGQEVDVEVWKSGGYEPDTNAWDIEWVFCDNELNGIELTDEEEQSIYEQLCESLRDTHDFDY